MFKFSSVLTKGILIKRYKRFLADVKLEDGSIVTVHCPNTGAMTGCAEPGSEVYLSTSGNKKRKYRHTWEYSTDDSLNKICVNTNNANKVVLDALNNHLVHQVSSYSTVLPEQKINSSRIDFLLQEDGMPDCYLEVKSVTLAADETAMFPDTITVRGKKHCDELAELALAGKKAFLLFCVMREGIKQFKIAEHIDPNYALSVKRAVEAGVELGCYGCNMGVDTIQLTHEIEIIY